MKKIFSFLILSVIGISLFAQDYEDDTRIKTLFDDNNFTNGGYGGFGIGYSVIDDKDAVVMSGRGAWLIGQSIGFGIAGAGFINDYHYDAFLGEDVNLSGGYGGILIEPIVFPRSPVHLAFPIIGGVGGIAYTRSYWQNDPWEYRNAFVEDTETFLIFEPGVELELNLLRFFRMGLGMTYRLTSNIDLVDTPSDVLNGITAGIVFKFGKF